MSSRVNTEINLVPKTNPTNESETSPNVENFFLNNFAKDSLLSIFHLFLPWHFYLVVIEQQLLLKIQPCSPGIYRTIKIACYARHTIQIKVPTYEELFE